jgi:hypothetical protein
MQKTTSLRISLAESLREKDRVVQSSSNLLSLLFRRIRADLSIDPVGWDKLMDRYLRNPLLHARIPQTSRPFH